LLGVTLVAAWILWALGEIAVEQLYIISEASYLRYMMPVLAALAAASCYYAVIQRDESRVVRTSCVVLSGLLFFGSLALTFIGWFQPPHTG
jgi:hypothetical protein